MPVNIFRHRTFGSDTKETFSNAERSKLLRVDRGFGKRRHMKSLIIHLDVVLRLSAGLRPVRVFLLRFILERLSVRHDEHGSNSFFVPSRTFWAPSCSGGLVLS